LFTGPPPPFLLPENTPPVPHPASFIEKCLSCISAGRKPLLSPAGVAALLPFAVKASRRKSNEYPLSRSPLLCGKRGLSSATFFVLPRSQLPFPSNGLFPFQASWHGPLRPVAGTVPDLSFLFVASFFFFFPQLATLPPNAPFFFIRLQGPKDSGVSFPFPQPTARPSLRCGHLYVTTITFPLLLSARV